MRDYKEYQEALDNVKQCENYYVNQDHIINKGTPNSNKLQELVEKEKQYKNIEEQLGIDLITLLNLIDNKIYLVDFIEKKVIKHTVFCVGIMKEFKYSFVYVDTEEKHKGLSLETLNLFWFLNEKDAESKLNWYLNLKETKNEE